LPHTIHCLHSSGPQKGPHTYALLTGATSRYCANLQCGQYDDQFVDALKGSLYKISVSCSFLCCHPISPAHTYASFVFLYLLSIPETVSYPGRSYYGGPDQQCSHCRAIFWHAEKVGKESRSSSDSVIYNKCCKGGKVVIAPFLPRPEPLASLAKFGGGASQISS
jgi:hypothetical protein